MNRIYLKKLKGIVIRIVGRESEEYADREIKAIVKFKERSVQESHPPWTVHLKRV